MVGEARVNVQRMVTRRIRASLRLSMIDANTRKGDALRFWSVASGVQTGRGTGGREEVKNAKVHISKTLFCEVQIIEVLHVRVHLLAASLSTASLSPLPRLFAVQIRDVELDGGGHARARIGDALLLADACKAG